MNWESETQGPRRGARGEEWGRALPGCSRTSAAHCELPKVPRPLALSTAELQEAPFQGSRRRHLPAAAAKPDGTPAGPAASSLPGAGRAEAPAGKAARGGGGRLRPCLAGLPSSWSDTRAEDRGERGKRSRLSLRNLCAAATASPGGAVPFSRRPRGGGRGRVCFPV